MDMNLFVCGLFIYMPEALVRWMHILHHLILDIWNVNYQYHEFELDL